MASARLDASIRQTVSSCDSMSLGFMIPKSQCLEEYHARHNRASSTLISPSMLCSAPKATFRPVLQLAPKLWSSAQEIQRCICMIAKRQGAGASGTLSPLQSTIPCRPKVKRGIVISTDLVRDWMAPPRFVPLHSVCSSSPYLRILSCPHGGLSAISHYGPAAVPVLVAWGERSKSSGAPQLFSSSTSNLDARSWAVAPEYTYTSYTVNLTVRGMTHDKIQTLIGQWNRRHRFNPLENVPPFRTSLLGHTLGSSVFLVANELTFKSPEHNIWQVWKVKTICFNYCPDQVVFSLEEESAKRHFVQVEDLKRQP
ncbi:hypothetical protein C8R45DRAFT_917850 [Mycena sanguinolenta]|nr:hypothetical protein C8R45DRAFT_917850 [Mycena sanguinolenta]